MNLANTIIISDLDETFLNYDGSLPKNSNKFFSLIKNNIFIVATSRHLNNILSLNLPVKSKYYAICSDGALVAKVEQNKYKIIHETLLNKNKINIFNSLKLLNKEFYVFTGVKNNFIIYHISQNFENYSLKSFLKIPNETREVITLSINNLSLIEKILSLDIRSITLFLDDKESKTVFNQIPNFLDSQKIIYNETRIDLNYTWIDIIPKTTNKYFGLQTLLDKEKIQGNLLAFGNGENDIDFFDLADKTFVPVNAIDSLKEKADYISKEHCGEKFIEDVLSKLNLINIRRN